MTFSTPLLQSCLTVQKMKVLVVLFLLWLHAGHQWISVVCGRTLISWTWTPYILQIVQSQFGIERNPRYGSLPIHPPSQFSHSRYSLIMSLYSPYFTIPGIKYKVSWIPYLPNPFLIFTSTRQELFDLFSIMACSALTGAASFIIPPSPAEVRQGKGKQKPD